MTTTTPTDPAFYPATMSCKDLTITNAVAAAAFKAWQNEGIRSGYMRLTSHLEIAYRAETGGELEGHSHDRYELAHRIMQRARKSGFIEATGDRSKPWRTVEHPEAEIEGARP